MLKGLDFSFGSGVTAAQIKAAGYQFVCRYLSGGNSKDISAAELAHYRAAGLPVVFVWETTGTDMTSKANGVADARAAQDELQSLSIATNDATVAGATVFFAADEAVEPALVAYMQGVISVIGKARAGIYGGLGSIGQAFNAGVATYGWQTAAWSGGNWDDRALLRQYGAVVVGPASSDLDDAAYWNSAKVLGLGDDFGQWPRPGTPPPPPPPPPAYPVPGSLHAVVTRSVALSWQDVKSPHYRVEVARGTPASPGIPFKSVTITGTTLTVVLPGSGPWVWHVQAAGGSPFTAWQAIA